LPKRIFQYLINRYQDAAGLNTTSAIYQHFKTKQMIAAALYTNILDSLSVSVDDIRRKNEKPSEQLRGIVDLLFKLTDDAPDVMRFLLLLKINEFLPDEKPILKTVPFVKIIKIIETGLPGEIRTMTPQLGYAYLFGIIDNTLRMVLNGALDKKADFYQSQAWLAAWNAIAKK
jgi:AcrR family transcriptional regulator